MAVDSADESLPPETRLKSDLAEMGKTLEALSRAASFSLARLEEKREDLAAEIQNHDVLEEKAEQLLRAGDEEAARRCLVLQSESASRVETLSASFQQLKKEAGDRVQRYREFEVEFNQRRDELPGLVEDIRAVQEMEEIEKQLSVFQVGGAQERFDEVKAGVQRDKLEQEARQLLEHPNAEVDRRIRETLEAGKIDTALKALQDRVAGALPSGAAEDPIASAREALGRPTKRLSSGDQEEDESKGLEDPSPKTEEE
jgi:phage shock protein A